MSNVLSGQTGTVPIADLNEANNRRTMRKPQKGIPFGVNTQDSIEDTTVLLLYTCDRRLSPCARHQSHHHMDLPSERGIFSDE